MTEAQPGRGRLPWLLFVTGAPGAGKSSVVEALLAHQVGSDSAHGVLVLDADWLLEPASALAGQDLTEAAALWPQYRGIWVRILEMVAQNGTSAALFTPGNPSALSHVRWSANVDWCLLDCDDSTRAERLRARGWTHEAIEEAIADARVLRGEIDFTIDTSRETTDETAVRLLDWFAAHQR